MISEKQSRGGWGNDNLKSGQERPYWESDIWGKIKKVREQTMWKAGASGMSVPGRWRKNKEVSVAGAGRAQGEKQESKLE